MGYSVSKILAPQRIMGVVKRVQGSRNSLANLFGFVGEGTNIVRPGGREFSYDVFNGTRTIPRAVTPISPRHLTNPQAVGNVRGVFPRAAETIQLLYEHMINQRKVGGPTSDLDEMGLDYITRQEVYLAERFANLIEFKTAAMLRGQYYFGAKSDTSYIHGWSTTGITGEETVNFQIPAGNKSQLDMLGDGDIIDTSWDSTNGSDEYDADIPAQIFGINAAMEALCGLPLEHLVMNSVTWNLMVKNQELKSQAGIANMPVQSFDRREGWQFQGLLKSLPWVTIHIMDHVLEIESAAGTFTRTKVLADNHVYGFPTPQRSWVAMGHGSEVVVEGLATNATTVERYGQYAWATPSDNPAGYNLHMVDNSIPMLFVPNAMVDATVVFGG